MWPLAHNMRVCEYKPHMCKRVLRGLHSGIPYTEFAHVQRFCNKFLNGKGLKGKAYARQVVASLVETQSGIANRRVVACARQRYIEVLLKIVLLDVYVYF